MATQTPNFNFDLRESADIFNPLSTNANFESLDTILKNLQESGGITTYTTTASALLLKLSGTPKVNDTVFKFVAAGDANTWTAATGGVVNNIVALDGKQATIKGGNMYVAWVNSANAMVCVAWPDVVDAQTFDGKGPNEWASAAQLQSVNTTAGNAVQTAQAAQTVANNALEVAQAAGMTVERVWSNSNPNYPLENDTVQFSATNTPKILAITFLSEGSGNRPSTHTATYHTIFVIPDELLHTFIFYSPRTNGSTTDFHGIEFTPRTSSIYFGQGKSGAGDLGTNNDNSAIPVSIYALY